MLQVPEQVIAQQVLELAQMHPQLERVLAECQRGCYHTGSPFRPVATTRRNTVGRRLRRSSKRNERTARDNRPLQAVLQLAQREPGLPPREPLAVAARQPGPHSRLPILQSALVGHSLVQSSTIVVAAAVAGRR